MLSFLPPYIYFMAISFLVSFTVYFTTKYQFKYLRLFPPFLLLSLTIDSIGLYRSSGGHNTVVLYNFFTLFEFCFYLLILSLVITRPRMRRFTRIALLAYAIISVCNIYFFQGTKSFHSVTYATGCLLMVGFCIYYFFELFRFPKSVNLRNNPSFWICCGLLFFYCCSFPLFGMANLLSSISRLIIVNFMNIINVLNIFLYSLFTIAFLCIIKTRKYISSLS
jgi:hypothetical protein